MKKYLLLAALFLLNLFTANANNLTIGVPSYNAASQTLSFTITWNNSWYVATGPSNYDAVWIFVKRQACTSTNAWAHQPLSTNSGNHSATAATSILTVDAVTDGMGVFVHRLAAGTGNISSHTINIKLIGNTIPVISTTDADNFKVFGIEMVNVPEGNFFIGDGRATNTNNFSNGSSATALQITSTTQSNGIGAASNYLSNVSYGCPVSLPADFPLGYNKFYCMKTEINQGQFTEFLNTLTYDQQTTLMGTYSGVRPNILNSYYANAVNANRCGIIVSAAGVYNTKPAVFSSSFAYSGANYLTFADLTAFLDWAALRPMTEFEYEKSCRGTLTAVANEKQTVLITGDISFLYDSNALWNNYIPKNLKIVLINNGGGGIFRILPGHDETPVFNTFFETSHCLTAEHLAKMYGFEYAIASDETSLTDRLHKMYAQNKKPYILEVFTPTRTNDSILLQYFRELV